MISSPKNQDEGVNAASYPLSAHEGHVPSLNTDTNMNRRAFFNSLVGRVCDFGAAGVATSCVVVGVDCANSLETILSSRPLCEKLSQESVRKDNAQTSDFIVRHPNGAVINVIGLYHTEVHYALSKDTLTEKVAPADIVLYEQGDFFEKHFGKPAQQAGKVSGPVEGVFTHMKAGLLLSVALWNGLFDGLSKIKRGLYFFLSAFHPNSSRRLVPGHTEKRREVFKDALKMFAYLYVSIGGGQKLAESVGNQHLLIADVSPLTDGRSMKMFANALAWAEKNPGKRIAVVVGDAHAQAMNFYASTPDGRVAFAVKNPAYNVLFLNCLDFTV